MLVKKDRNIISSIAAAPKSILVQHGLLREQWNAWLVHLTARLALSFSCSDPAVMMSAVFACLQARCREPSKLEDTYPFKADLLAVGSVGVQRNAVTCFSLIPGRRRLRAGSIGAQ